MGVGELLKAAEAVAADGAPDRRLGELAREAMALADMVGWAQGPIDPEGRFAARLDTLLAGLRRRHAADSNEALAALHDALAELGDTVARHDRDLDASAPDDEEIEP